MRKYVITESELCAGLCREEDLENHRVIEPDIKVVYTFTSNSWTEAMQTFNDFYGYGIYKSPTYDQAKRPSTAPSDTSHIS